MTAVPDLLSPRLRLVALDPRFLQWCMAAHHQCAADWLGCDLPAEWLESWTLMALRHRDLTLNPAYAPWGLRAIITRDSDEMIGHIGFHTPPDPAYLRDLGTRGIEVGYEIYPAKRRQGYASEALYSMLSFAAAQGVSHAILSISPTNLPSTRLAMRYGFSRFGEQMDEEDGLEIIYRLPLDTGLPSPVHVAGR